MPGLLEDLKARRVVRTVVTYAVVAWGMVQVVVTVAPELGLPEWSGRAAIVLALLGFPVAAALSWAYDLSAEGVRRWRVATALVVVAGVAALGAGLFLRARPVPEEEIRTVLDEAEALAASGQVLAAWELLDTARAAAEGDPRIDSLRHELTQPVDIVSQPEGARVSVAVWHPGRGAELGEMRVLGETPLLGIRLPLAIHYLRLEKEGYQPAERPLTTAALGDWEGWVDQEVEVVLEPEGAGRPEMVRVSGGTYTLVSTDLPRGLTAELDDFLIDRYEVTNEEFAEFVRAGGYDDRRVWEHPFVTGGDTLDFEAAMERFTDRTGLPGPRSWSAQAYAPGTGRHPVTGVSWYEAAAYAAFRDKQLPTAYQWEKAARDGRFATGEAIVLPWGLSTVGSDSTLANFGGSATVPVDAMPFGISPWGAHAMAGNVAEWLLNASGEGRAVTGGSWDGPLYLFGEFVGLDPFRASPSLGFRLVYLESDRQRRSRDQGAEAIAAEPVVPDYTPVSREEALSFRRYFDYDPVDPEPEVVERIDEGRWIREAVTIRSPRGDRIPVYLYLPKSALPPYQTLLYVPSGATLYGTAVTDDAELVMGPVARSGRAVVTLAMTGMTGHPWPVGREIPNPSSVAFRDEVLHNAVEMRAVLDYLATRPDIDMDRLGYAAFSFGAGSRGALLSADSRFDLAVLLGAGIDERVRPVRPEVDPVNYAPYLELPILVVQGRHDEEHPYFTRFLPLYRLLPEEWTTLELVPGGGHLVQPADRIPVITEFLDEQWEPVER